MIDATSGSVIDDGPAGTTELMVEIDTGRKGKKSDKDTHHEVLRSAGAVTLQGKYVFAGPKNRFDALTDGSEMGSPSLLVCSHRPHDGASQFRDLLCKLPASIALVTPDGLPASKGPGKQKKGHFPLRAVGRSQLGGSGSAVRGAEKMKATTPKPAGMAAGISISGDIGQSRAPRRLHRAAAFDRSRVKQQKVVFCPRALGAEDAKEPFDGFHEADSPFVIGVLSREFREEMPDLSTSSPQEAPVRGDAHKDLGHLPR